jgi:hypothetical protein
LEGSLVLREGLPVTPMPPHVPNRGTCRASRAEIVERIYLLGVYRMATCSSASAQAHAL